MTSIRRWLSILSQFMATPNIKSTHIHVTQEVSITFTHSTRPSTPQQKQPSWHNTPGVEQTCTQHRKYQDLATVRGLAHGMIHEPSMIHIMSTMQSHYSVGYAHICPNNAYPAIHCYNMEKWVEAGTYSHVSAIRDPQFRTAKTESLNFKLRTPKKKETEFLILH